MTYEELKKKHQDEVNAFPFGFAFSYQQFVDMMQKWGLTENDTDKIYSIGSGGYIRRSDSERMHEMFERHEKERKEFRKNRRELYKGFINELWNHEYIYGKDDEAVLSCFGYTPDDLMTDSDLRAVYKRAVKDYRAKA